MNGVESLENCGRIDCAREKMSSYRAEAGGSVEIIIREKCLLKLFIATIRQ